MNSDGMKLVSHHLDVSGFFCPVPLYETKKALTKLPNGSVIRVLADDPETLHDIPMYIDRTEHKLISTTQDSGEFNFIIEVIK